MRARTLVLVISIQTEPADGEVCVKRPTDGDQTRPPEPLRIQRCLESIRLKHGKGEVKALPMPSGREVSTVRLPRADIVRCTKVHRVPLVIAAYTDPHTGKPGRIEDTSTGVEVQRCLYETAVVL